MELLAQNTVGVIEKKILVTLRLNSSLRKHKAEIFKADYPENRKQRVATQMMLLVAMTIL